MEAAKKLDNEVTDFSIDSIYNQTEQHNHQRFMPIAVALLTPNVDIPFDLYYKVQNQFVLYKDKSIPLSSTALQALIEKNTQVVFLRKEDLPKFLLLLEDNMANYLASSLSLMDKAKLLKSCSLKLVEDLFKNPNVLDFNRATKVAKNLTKYILTDKDAFRMMMTLKGHDEYTYLHSVGVACTAVEMSVCMGLKNPDDLVDIATAGFLHDIGKAKIPWSIINKEGPLNDAEWEEMEKHAMYGFSLIRSNESIELRSKMAILQHHEAPGGKGYPAGLEGSQLDVMTKVITICDIFSALTSNRSYSKKRSYFDALSLMKNDIKEKIDMNLFNSLVKIHGENYKR